MEAGALCGQQYKKAVVLIAERDRKVNNGRVFLSYSRIITRKYKLSTFLFQGVQAL